MVHQFKIAPLDKSGKLVTGIALIDAVCTLGLIWLIPFLFSPRGYTVSPKGIVIRTPITSHIIPMTEIKSVDIIGYAKAGVGLTWQGGLFGNAGLFALVDGSTANVYATCWDQMVRVRTISGDPYLLSPVEPKGFVETVKKYINIQ